MKRGIGKEAYLPSQGDKPADSVTQYLLKMFGGKFRNPMILSTRRRCLRIVVVSQWPHDLFARRDSQPTMDAISAMDNMMANMPQQTISTSQMSPAVPPLAREKTLVTRVNSQVRPKTMT